MKAPFDALISYTETAVARKAMAEEEGERLIKKFQEMNVIELTKKK